MLRSLRYFTFPRQIRRLLVQAGVLVPAVRIGLWALPPQWIVRWVGRPHPVHRRPSADAPTIAQVVRCVGAISKRVPRATCLTQAIAAQLLLARYGYSSVIKIGAGRKGEGLHAHAWVEVEGFPVIGGGPGLRSYSEFTDLQDALN